jgi:hypothetical protein
VPSMKFSRAAPPVLFAMATFGCEQQPHLPPIDAPIEQTVDHIIVLRNGEYHLVTSAGGPSAEGYERIKYDPKLGLLIGVRREGSYVLDINTGVPAHDSPFGTIERRQGVYYTVTRSGICGCDTESSPMTFKPGSQLTPELQVAPSL